MLKRLWNWLFGWRRPKCEEIPPNGYDSTLPVCAITPTPRDVRRMERLFRHEDGGSWPPSRASVELTEAEKEAFGIPVNRPITILQWPELVRAMQGADEVEAL